MPRAGLVAAFLACLLLSCNEKRPQPSTAPPDSAFVRYYADRMILEEENRIAKADSLTAGRLRDSLNLVYGLTEAAAREKLDSYKSDIKNWKQFFDRVTKRLEILQQPR
jgi:hypothetical protein